MIIHDDSIKLDELTKRLKPAAQPEESANYNGPGLVVNNEDLNKPEEEMPSYTGITPESQSNINKYLEEMDETIDILKERADERGYADKLKGSEEDYNDDDEDVHEETEKSTDNFDKDKYDEAIVIIDKAKFGQVINFTDEEREKLTKAKKIKLEEVENVSLDTITIKKPKKKDIKNIIKRVTNIATTHVVLPFSGYTAEISGCSAYELMSLIETDDNPLLNMQRRWSLIHDKIKSTSIGKMDFNEFLTNTASSDYDTFIYGILCSTYPDDDEIPLTCASPKCKKSFSHKYSVRSLIRAEKMEDRLKDTIMEIVDNSASIEDAKKVHDNSLISHVKRIKLPYSEIFADVYIQTAHDLINKSIKTISEHTNDERYAQTAPFSTLIKAFYIPDDDGKTYYDISDATDISDVLYNMSDIDLGVIRKIGQNLLNDMDISYGFVDVKCPHCGHVTSLLEVKPEDILFLRYRQALSTHLE